MQKLSSDVKKYVGNIQNFRVECNAALDEFDDVDEYNENWMIRLNKFQETAHSFELDMPELSKLDLVLLTCSTTIRLSSIRELYSIYFTVGSVQITVSESGIRRDR